MKICHIAATSEGATWMFQQLRELRDCYGHDVSAIISGENGSLAKKLRSENIPFHVWDFEFIGSKDIFSLPIKIIKLARLLRKEKYDVVQTHLFNSMVIGRLAAWLANTDVRVSMIAGPYHLEAYTPRWIDRSTCWLDSVVIASCEYTRQLYLDLGVKDRKLELVYYGPDANEFSPENAQPAALKKEYGLDNDTPLVIMVAYFYPIVCPSNWSPPHLWGLAIKGHEYLIRAMPNVLNEFPNARCILVGSGWGDAGTDYQNQMKQLVVNLGLEEKVIFTGFRSDANNILRAASVAVQPSINENLGGTIESLLMKCPTVASRIGGMTDSVRDYQTGLLVNPADEQDLAKAIIKLISSPTLAQTLGENGRKFMLDHFTLDRTVMRLNQIYTNLFLEKQQQPKYQSLSSLRFLLAPILAFYLASRLILVDTIIMPRGQILRQLIKSCSKKTPRQLLHQIPKKSLGLVNRAWLKETHAIYCLWSFQEIIKGNKFTGKLGSPVFKTSQVFPFAKLRKVSLLMMCNS